MDLRNNIINSLQMLLSMKRLLIIMLILLSACTSSQQKESKVDNKVVADQFISALYPENRPLECLDCDQYIFKINREKVNAYASVNVLNGQVVYTEVGEGRAG
jgi:hypothetical protein